MNKNKNKIVKIIFLISSLIAIVIAWQIWNYNNFLSTPINISKQGLVYNIKPGMTLIRIINDLKSKNIITNTQYLLWHARLTGTADKIRVGEFNIPFKSNPKQLLSILVSHKVISYGFTIIEGWNFSQLIKAVNENDILKHTIIELNNAEIMSKLGLNGVHHEGRFLPDTYLFPRGTTDIEFLKRAYSSMTKFLDDEWQEREVGLPLSSPYEALILASIIEKETGKVSERKKIAGVFIRRLQTKMRLQSDPTVIYGMGERYKGNIRRSDLKQKTPYNTYRRHGLPPTPIAMPGRDAIYSTLHPDDSDSLYFVARGDGSHYFSSNLREHNNAVIKYQLKGKKKSFSSYDASKGK
ncbi:FIG004453: protein YceG like [hydrothermal vent metagenome]|uniref:FIG004453: protein YceG like n=1 Tax=hydrothermal vent metagenome TaxID=652676 RepID=A0A3B0ZBN1_9ZZZZ